MAKVTSVAVSESQLGLLGSTKEFVVTGVSKGSFTIANNEQIIKVEGEITGLKMADLVVLKDQKLHLKGTENGSARKHNPPSHLMADYDIK